MIAINLCQSRMLGVGQDEQAQGQITPLGRRLKALLADQVFQLLLQLRVRGMVQRANSGGFRLTCVQKR